MTNPFLAALAFDPLSHACLLGPLTSWLAAQPLPRDPRAIEALPRPPAISCGSATLPAGRQQS